MMVIELQRKKKTGRLVGIFFPYRSADRWRTHCRPECRTLRCTTTRSEASDHPTSSFPSLCMRVCVGGFVVHRFDVYTGEIVELKPI